MKINTLFKRNKAVFSFEVFPPKKDSPIESVYGKLEEICALKPDFVSVTYGAGGSGAHSRRSGCTRRHPPGCRQRRSG